jgi:hypothetical protein
LTIRVRGTRDARSPGGGKPPPYGYEGTKNAVRAVRDDRARDAQYKTYTPLPKASAATIAP